MKRSICILLTAITVFCLCLTSACGANTQSTVLAEPKVQSFKKDHNALKNADELLDGLAAFSAKFTQEYSEDHTENDNFSISPVSVFMALALAAKCADGQTKKELLTALGTEEDQLDLYGGGLYRTLNVDYTISGAFSSKKTVALSRLTNSIWLDDNVSFKRPFLNELAQNFYCHSYKVPFVNDNKKANLAIREFVKNKTNGLIDQDFKLSIDTLFALINTLYVKDMWNMSEDLLQTRPKDFINADGSITKTPYLLANYIVGKPFKGENYSAFYARTAHGYSLYFMVPTDGYSAKQIFTAANILELIQTTKQNQSIDYDYKTRCIFPEFTASSNKDIKQILYHMGIRQMFDSCANMSNLTDEKVFCEKVIHSTKLKVDKTGIEGAAVTVIPGDKSAAPVTHDLDFYVDRAFAFMFLSPENIPMFSGIVNKI